GGEVVKKNSLALPGAQVKVLRTPPISHVSRTQAGKAQAQRLAEPEGVDRVIVVGIAGIRMDQDRKPAPIQHEPGDNFRKFAAAELDLVHRSWMRANGLIVPTAHCDPKFLFDRATQS